MSTSPYLAQGYVNLEHFEHNIHQFKTLLQPDTKFLAVLKADAYGHGAVPLAQWIEKNKKADYLGVAQLVEALALREINVQMPILLFGPVQTSQLPLALERNITLPIFSVDQAESLIEAVQSSNKKAKVHLKVDSGMGRIGVRSPKDALAVFDLLSQYSSQIEIEGIFTHFSDAEEFQNNSYTAKQYELFTDCIDAIERKDFRFKIKHCCNTAATILCPDYHLDMVRVGIALYGYYPDGEMTDNLKLKPVMTVKAPVTHLKKVPAETYIGYGRTYQATQDRQIATIALGYADGLNRNLSNQTALNWDNHPLEITGRICMDQAMLDVTSVKDQIELGDEVTYIGDHTSHDQLLSLYDLADKAQSFHYEMLCLLGSRIERKYLTTDNKAAE